MTQEDILAMQPGIELNLKVAEKVMEHLVKKDEIWGDIEIFVDSAAGLSSWWPVSRYSEDISAAELVVERMIAMGYEDAIYWADFGKGQYAEAEAICKAALLAVLEGALEDPSDRILRQALGDKEEQST